MHEIVVLLSFIFSISVNANAVLPNWDEYFSSLQKRSSTFGEHDLNDEILCLKNYLEEFSDAWKAVSNKVNTEDLRSSIDKKEQNFLLMSFALKNLQDELEREQSCETLYHNILYFNSGQNGVNKIAQTTLDIAKNICNPKK